MWFFFFVCCIDAFGGQIEVLDNLFVDLEEVCEQLDLERRKTAQGLKLNMLRHNREYVQEYTISFSSVCPVIENEFHHNIVRVAVDPRSHCLMDPQLL